MQRLPIVVLVCAIGAYGQGVVSLRSGLLNYSQGHLQTTDPSVRTPHAGAFHLRAGHRLVTDTGRAELLLGPAVFLRIAERSEILMENDRLGDVKVSLIRGSAIVEVVDIVKESRYQMGLRDSVATIANPGIYRFDADTGEIRVYDGKLEVAGAAASAVPLKKGKMLVLSADSKPQDFDRKGVDGLQRWSARRALTVAQSNLTSARASYGQGWRRMARPWIWSVLNNAPAARTAPQTQSVPSGY